MKNIWKKTGIAEQYEESLCEYMGKKNDKSSIKNVCWSGYCIDYII